MSQTTNQPEDAMLENLIAIGGVIVGLALLIGWERWERSAKESRLETDINRLARHAQSWEHMGAERLVSKGQSWLLAYGIVCHQTTGKWQAWYGWTTSEGRALIAVSCPDLESFPSPFPAVENYSPHRLSLLDCEPITNGEEAAVWRTQTKQAVNGLIERLASSYPPLNNWRVIKYGG